MSMSANVDCICISRIGWRVRDESAMLMPWVLSHFFRDFGIVIRL
jgi:uncharacterized protein YhjY with autotransporter beta-barrel domain